MKFAVLCVSIGLVTFMSCSKQDSMPPMPPAKSAAPQNTLAQYGLKADSVFEVSEMVTVETERTRLQQNFMATDFTPTGLYLPPSGTVTIRVAQLAGSRLPKLIIGTYSRNAALKNPLVVQLKEGDNHIADVNGMGGLMYLRFTSDVPQAKAKVSFIGGYQPVPFFVAGKTTQEDWKKMLTAFYAAPDVQLVGEKNIVVVSRSRAQRFQDQDPAAVLAKLAEVIRVEDMLSGLDGASANGHKYLLTETDEVMSGVAAYATNYRTAYLSVADNMLNIYGVSTDGWAIWHELGHQHQQVWTWPAITEATVNIYSLAVQRAFNSTSPSRLQRDGYWPQAVAYTAKPDAGKDFNSDTQTNPWIRLCMFEQLRLAFGENFYHELHKQTRMDKPVFLGSTSEATNAKMNYFMKAACKAANADLSQFFRKWGVNTASAVYNEIAALHLPAPAKDISQITE